MAFYMEYPKRKLPHGVPPSHTSEPPNLSASVVNLSVNVAKTAQKMSPKCQSGLRLSDKSPLSQCSDKSPLTQCHKVKQTVTKITKKKGLALEKRPQVKSILYPSRTLSPRPKNNNNVKWPDVPQSEGNDDDSLRQQVQRNCLSAAVNEAMVSFSLVLCCGGESEEAGVPPATAPVELLPLETVYELEHSSDMTLTVKTDLLLDDFAEYDRENELIDVDPILAFRDKKLKKKKSDHPEEELNSATFTFSSSSSSSDDDEDDDDSILEQRDDLSTGGEDWAPVVRRTKPPPPILSPSQLKLRNDASLRYEELHDFLLQNDEQTPCTENAIQERETNQLPPKEVGKLVIQRPAPLEVYSASTWSTDYSQLTCSMDDKPIQRKSPRIFGLKPRPKKKTQNFAEIEWKNAPPPSPDDIAHVSEIPWKTHEGRHVSKMKKEHLTKKQMERQPSYIQADLAREWEEEIKEVLKSPPRNGDGSSSSLETELDGRDRYNHSCRSQGREGTYTGSTGEKIVGPIIEI